MKSRNFLLPVFFSLILPLLVSINLKGQSLKGTWYALTDIYSFKLRIVLHIDSTQNGLLVRSDIPEWNEYGKTVKNFSYESPNFRFVLYKRFTFEGRVNPGFSQIPGEFKYEDFIQRLTFTRDSIPPDESSIVSIKARYSKKEVFIPMRDGVKLYTSIYAPKDTSQTYPMLMMRTPYGTDFEGGDNFSLYLTVYYRFIKENYIIVLQDVRGRFMSEGQFENMRPFNPDKRSNMDIDEASDTYDAVDWLVRNIPHHNGNMGVTGLSYPGFYSTMAILSGHPAIKAVSPQAPIADWFLGDDVHHNGAFFLLNNFIFDYSQGRTFKAPSRKGFPEFKWPDNDNYKFFLDLGPIKNATARYFGDSIIIWRNDMNHPDYDDFWKARNPCQYLKSVKPAVLTVGGWFDAENLYGAVHTYQAIERQNSGSHPNYLVMGPWYHGQWTDNSAENLGNIYWGQEVNNSFREIEVNFFNYYLRDKGKADFPEATIFITGANEWRSFSNWPPANTVDQKLYLQPSGKLSFTPPSGSESFDEYTSDPMKPVPYAEKIHRIRSDAYMTDDQRFASRRPDVMIYETDTLTEDITLTGPLVADLFVSTTGTDADYVVKLIDVFPQYMQAPTDKDIDVPLGGYQMLIRGEVLRGRYRNSFEYPEPFIPGKVAEIKYELPDVAHTFKKGHRIMIQVQNSWFPLVDRNPQKFVDIYHCSEEDFQKATHRIFHDRLRASFLQITVLN